MEHIAIVLRQLADDLIETDDIALLADFVIEHAIGIGMVFDIKNHYQ